jgi:hypothetical protein
MAFVILLLISMSSLLQVEHQASAQSKQRILARNNALLGLKIALGETQRYLGPDARVSARIEIYDDDPTTDAIEGINNRWLTSVWSSKAPNQLPRQLISGIRQSDFDPEIAVEYPSGYLNPRSDALAAPGTDDTVAELYTDASRPENDLRASKETIESGGNAGSGEFAWIVIDEGIKAKFRPHHSPVAIELNRPAYANSSTQSTEFYAIDHYEEMSHLTFGSPGWDNAQRIHELSDLDHLATTPANPISGRVIHDATNHSAGIIAKTTFDPGTEMWGGLKRDLTNAFRPSGIDPILDNRTIFPAESTLAGDSGGPLWNQLYDWVNLTPANSASGFDAAYSDVPFVGNRSPIHPVLTLAQMHVNLLIVEEPTPGQYAIWYYFRPAFVLWNPYNAEISGSGGTWIVDSQLSFSKAPELKWKHRVELRPLDRSSGDPVVKFPTTGSVEGGEFYQSIAMLTPPNGRIPFELNLNRNMRAGEAIVFSPSEPYTQVDDGVTAWTLKPGFRGGFCFAFKVPDSVFTLDTANYEISLIHTISDQRVSGVIRLARSESELETSPLQHIDRLNCSGFDSPSKRDSLYAVTNEQLSPYRQTVAQNSIEDIHANFAYRAGMKFAQSRLEIYESANPSSIEYFRTQWLEDYDPTATYSGRSPLEYEARSGNNGGTSENPSWIADFFLTEELSADLSDPDIPTDGDNAFLGFSDASGAAITRAALFHLPRSPLEIRSIGDLMHARLSLAKNANEATSFWKWGNTQPAYAIGNSTASPYLNPGQTFRDTWPDFNPPGFGPPVYYDMPWQLNSALWDDYFFSAVPEQADRSFPLVSENNRILSAIGNESAALDSMVDAASELMIDGAFNVNSTSVAAWESLLGTFLGSEVATTGDTTRTFADASPWLRHRYPQSFGVDPKLGTLPEDSSAYSGFRALSRTEIRDLSEAIVEQVKLRGPFTSLAEFVNRAPVPTSHISRMIDEPEAWQKKGALQAAIDNSGINSAFYDAPNSNAYSVEAPDELYKDSIANSRYFKEFYRGAMAGSLAANAPGYLSQADLLAKLGSVLAVRSDTFRIRAYGEARNSTGTESTQAWCEAIIQRIPEKIDPTENVTDGDRADGFGRRFIIKSFRWLQPDEV